MANKTCFSKFLGKFISDLINTGALNPSQDDLNNLQAGVGKFLTALTNNAPERSQSEILKGSFDCSESVTNNSLSSFRSSVSSAIIVVVAVTIIVCISVALVLLSDEIPPLKLVYTAVLSLALILASLVVFGSIRVEVRGKSNCKDSLEKNEEIYLFQAAQSVNSATCAYSH